jgi:uncharacterized protein YdeI (YjbR/CyaY-like superfamily)
MEPVYFSRPADFRRWLEQNHRTATELVVGFYKRDSGRPSITWPEAVDEALCFGWIDGVRRSISDVAYSIRFTPRKPTSVWSAVNVAKVMALRKAKKMAPAGLKAYSLRTPERTGVYSFERLEAAKLTAAQSRRLAANKKAFEHFRKQPNWYRRTATYWVVSAKKEQTRERRLDHLIAESAAGRPIRALNRKQNTQGTAQRRVKRAARAK